MKTLQTAIVLTFLLLFGSQADAQLSSLADLTNSVDQAASQLEEKSNTFLGFQKLKMPKMLDGLVDVRLKKPTIPGLGLLDKIKNFGNPTANTTSTSPLTGLSKLFQPPQTNGQGFFSKLFGPKDVQTPTFGSVLNNGSVPNFGGAAQQFQQQAGQMSQDVRSSANQLLNGNMMNNANSVLQPPLQTARQYSEQIESRY